MTTKVLVLIDLQKESNFGLFNLDRVISNSQKLIAACREQGIPIIYTRQINRMDGIGLSKGEPLKADGTPLYYADHTDQIEIIDDLKPHEGDIVIDKYRWSAFYETSLDVMLKSFGAEEVIMGGVVTDGCLMTSVFDAYFRDYEVHLVSDMVTASNRGAHQSAMLTLANWVYNLNIYRTDEMIKKLNGQPFEHWRHEKTDDYQFTEATLNQEFKRLTGDDLI